jgi:hypothetical protein
LQQHRSPSIETGTLVTDNEKRELTSLANQTNGNNPSAPAPDSPAAITIAVAPPPPAYIAQGSGVGPAADDSDSSAPPSLAGGFAPVMSGALDGGEGAGHAPSGGGRA